MIIHLSISYSALHLIIGVSSLKCVSNEHWFNRHSATGEQGAWVPRPMPFWQKVPFLCKQLNLKGIPFHIKILILRNKTSVAIHEFFSHFSCRKANFSQSEISNFQTFLGIMPPAFSRKARTHGKY